MNATLGAAAMRLLGERYELGVELGRGGMGVVWRATDRRLGREVAIKVLHPWIAEDADLRERFEREAAALAKLTHPHIVRVYDFEQSGEAAFLVLELIEGVSFSELLRAETKLAWERGRRFLAPVASALAHAHARGVVHRDLTPANILVESENGRVVVSDFGLARIARAARSLTATGVLIGTPEYWSPEQATGTETDGSTDMYAFGCILFRALAGRLPFVGDDRLAVGLRRAYEDAPAIESVVGDVPDEARTLIAALLSRDPTRRPGASVVEKTLAAAPEPSPRLGAAPSSAAEAETVLGPDRKVTQQQAPTARRGPRRLLLALAVAAALAAAVGLAIMLGADSVDPEAKVQAGPARPLIVPRLVGVTSDQAEKRVAIAARKAGVKPPRLYIERQVYSEKFKPGVIVSQAPRPGARVPVDGMATLRVSVSNGSAWARVPPVVGKKYDIASDALRGVGLSVERTTKPSWSASEGTVLGSEPSAGARAHRAHKVRLVVSSGVPTIRIPNLLGDTAAAAREELQTKGLRYAERTQATSQAADDGRVISTRPQWGSEAPVGSTVEVIVGHKPRWQVVYRFSGTDVRQSPVLKMPEKWRIKYTIVGDLAGAIVTWRAEDGFEDSAEIDSSYGGGEIDPGAGGGRYAIIVQPTGYAATYGTVKWAIVVEAYE